MTTVRNLSGISLNDLFASFSLAFQDYERTFTNGQFESILQRRGYVPELSFGVFDGDELVSFTLNGIGLHENVRTAYDTGTGTIKEHRGRGFAKQISNYSIPFLKQHGVEQYLLEVLTTNNAAISLYSNMGFEKSREFNYYIGSASLLSPITKNPSGIDFREIDLSWIGEMRQMCDSSPSWQNGFDSLFRASERFKILGAFHAGNFLGYGIIEPLTGDIPQLAVAKPARRQGIGSAILNRLIQYNEAESIRFINVDAGSTSAIAFMENCGIAKTGSQFEMIRKL